MVFPPENETLTSILIGVVIYLVSLVIFAGIFVLVLPLDIFPTTIDLSTRAILGYITVSTIMFLIGSRNQQIKLTKIENQMSQLLANLNKS